ncbi:addiction module protein [Mucilaginibacter sp. BJC16-A38]|uniref:addiction module protein n=1 Tax=Mucilaginibacter phenanthrenivorans TaxID=1234842 RepID=UPI0021575DF8|nr:addiction module protein [Mucilaginibacter phenanthrenivorans]MCR8560607.1 addiction module protein [Mucilaginibacter phenanthrenivorans]
METLKIDIQSDQEKKVLIAFLDSLSYHYRSESDDYILTDDQVKEMVRRKADFLAGKTTSRPWNEIKTRYEGV